MAACTAPCCGARKSDFCVYERLLSQPHIIQTVPSAHPGSTRCTRACRFADRLDTACMTVGFIGAAATGAAMPLFSILFGDL